MIWEYFDKKVLSSILKKANSLLAKMSNNNMYEYWVKLDGYYYHARRQCLVAILRLRNKRTIEKIPVRDIITDPEYLKSLHPFDACILGILAHQENNGIISNHSMGSHAIHKFKDHNHFTKIEPLLEISKKYLSQNGTEITVLRAKRLNKEIAVPTREIWQKRDLLYALDSLQAIEIGYETSEYFMRSADCKEE